MCEKLATRGGVLLSPCRHLATQGALLRPAGRRSVATQVTKMRPFGGASYLIEALTPYSLEYQIYLVKVMQEMCTQANAIDQHS